MQAKRDIAEIKSELLEEMRKRLHAEESIHFLIVELLDALVKLN